MYIKLQTMPVQMSPERTSLAATTSNSASLQNILASGPGDIAHCESNRSCLPLSDNNVSTTNDNLIDRDWDIPCETDDINVNIPL